LSLTTEKLNALKCWIGLMSLAPEWDILEEKTHNGMHFHI